MKCTARRCSAHGSPVPTLCVPAPLTAASSAQVPVPLSYPPFSLRSSRVPSLARPQAALPQAGILPVSFPAAPEKSALELADSMQADAPRACRFGRRWYLNNESWHPSVPPFGEMKCILCWCVVSVPAWGSTRGMKAPLCQSPGL